MVTPTHRKLCGHLTQYLCIPWSGKNECHDCNPVGFRVFVDLRDFQNIPALVLHPRNCQIAHRVLCSSLRGLSQSDVTFRLGDDADASSSVVPPTLASRALIILPFVFTSIEDVGIEATAASRVAFIDCLRRAGPIDFTVAFPPGDLDVCGDGTAIIDVDACGVDVDIASPGTCAWKEVVGIEWDR